MKRFSFLFAFILLISSCNEQIKEDTDSTTDTAKVKGNREHGGTFYANENEYLHTLYPLGITDAVSLHIAGQVYEGLLQLDPNNLSLKNGLAKRFTIDSTGTLYTFYLREDVLFHDDKCFPDGEGRTLTANDIAWCFKRICTPDSLNKGFHLFKNLIKGADAYAEAMKKGNDKPEKISGINVIDQHTISIELTRPSIEFKYYLTEPFAYIYPKEAYETYGEKMKVHAVGTGPFTIHPDDDKLFRQNEYITLKRNKDYYKKDKYDNQLPFLDKLHFTFIKHKKEEMEAFKDGEIDMIYRLPTEDIIHLMDPDNQNEDAYEVARIQELSTHFLGFNNHKGVFTNKNLRKAISFAINKQLIVDKTLQGEADHPGHHGVTPLAFEDYDAASVNGYQFNVDSALYYFKKAGYEKGGLAEVELEYNPDGDRNTRVAKEIKEQLKKHLGVTIKLKELNLAEHSENIENGTTHFFLAGWVYDYPSPHNLLNTFYSSDLDLSEGHSSYPDLTRYDNPAFNKLFEKAITSKNEGDELKNLLKAEKTLMKDAPVVVLWYDEGYRLLQERVQNLPLNAIQYRDFSEVYLKQDSNQHN